MNKFILLSAGPTYGINRRFGSLEEKFNINCTKPKTKFFFTLHYNADISYFFVNGKEIIKFKADNKNVNFTTQMSANESREVSLNGKK